MCRESNTGRVGLVQFYKVYFVVHAVRVVVGVRWFIPIHDGFILIQAAFNALRPLSSKIKDPEKYLGLNFFLFNLAISVNFGAGF